MYVPSAFRELDERRLIEFVERHSFGMLVSRLEEQLFATHLPMLLRRAEGSPGQLIGHMARANPQWRELSGQDVMAVFSGPHAYISPTWYEAAEVVPTWNYVAVHVYGNCQIVDDQTALGEILSNYVATYERSMPRPWSIDPHSSHFRKLLGAIVGFRIEISRFEGKWKLSQNHPIERRQRAIRHLADRQDEASREIAQLMTETLAKPAE